MQKTCVRSLGWEDPLEKGMGTHSSILAWRIPRTEEPGRLQSKMLQWVGCDWVTIPNLRNSYSSRYFRWFSGNLWGTLVIIPLMGRNLLPLRKARWACQRLWRLFQRNSQMVLSTDTIPISAYGPLLTTLKGNICLDLWMVKSLSF